MFQDMLATGSGGGGGSVNSYIIFSPNNGNNYLLYIKGVYEKSWVYTSHIEQFSDDNISVVQSTDTSYSITYKKNCVVRVGTGAESSVTAGTTTSYDFRQNVYAVF